MRSISLFLATFHILTALVVAQPFVILDSNIAVVEIQVPRPTPNVAKRQDTIADAIDDLLNGGDDDDDDDKTTTTKATSTKASSTKTSATTKSAVTLPPPAVATTTSEENSKSTSTKDKSTSTSVSESSTSTQTPTIATSTTAAATTSASPTSATSTISNAAATSSANINKSQSKDEDGGMPPGGLAVAVIMALLIVAVIAWLIFKYHPKSRAWWAAREEKKFRERSYREGIDGRGAGSPDLAGGLGRKKTIKSFFAPVAVNLGNGQEIRRKPVNWGAETPTMPASPAMVDIEKSSLAAAAAPMGRSPPPRPSTDKPLPAVTPSFASKPVSPVPSFCSELPAEPAVRVAPLPVELPSPSVPQKPKADANAMSASAAPLGQIERYSYMPPTTRRSSQAPTPPPPMPAPAPPLPTSRQLTPTQSRISPPTTSRSLTSAPPSAPPKQQQQRQQPQPPPTSAISPISLRARESLDRLPPISPLSTHTKLPSISQKASDRDLPSLPPVPTLPGAEQSGIGLGLVHAKRGSDGVFRLS